MSLRIYTIGHSTRPIAEFLEMLTVHRVTRLVDVRTVPRSGHNPQYGKEVLSASLEAQGIRYQHLPGLGGLRRPRPDSVNRGWRNTSFRGYADYMASEPFAAALGRLLGSAARSRTVMMCAEAVPWRCHRRLIADAATAAGADVLHILGPGRADRHQLDANARVVVAPDPTGVRLVYDGSPREMPPRLPF